MDTQKVLPCPFCGSAEVNIYEYAEDFPGYFYVCFECKTIGPAAKSAQSALERWNNRPQVTG